MTAIFTVLRYLWALPASLLGVAAAVAACAFGASVRRVDGVVEVAGGRLRAVMMRLPEPCRFSAITLGHVIIGLDHPTLTRCRAHEHVHVAQYERWGGLFLLLYPMSSLIQLLRGRHPYFDNVFEREAFESSSPGGRSPR